MQRSLGGHMRRKPLSHERHRAANAKAFSAVFQTVRGIRLALKAPSGRWTDAKRPSLALQDDGTFVPFSAVQEAMRCIKKQDRNINRDRQYQ